MNLLRARLAELPQYFLVSCGALAADSMVLLLLNREFAVPYLPAATISFILGGVVAYQLSIRFVWHTTTATTYEASLFLLLGVAGLAINAVIMFCMISELHVALLLSKAAAAGCTFICNYLLRRRLVFPNATRRVFSWLPGTPE
jgi:putative flippase GtrA